MCRAAWMPVMRGIATSSTAMSGLWARAFSTASTPSSASATTFMPSWRSSSIRTPARTMPWSSAISMWSKAFSLGDVEPDTSSAPGGGSDTQLPAHETCALGHPGQPDVPAVLMLDRPLGVEALAVVAHAQLDAVRREHAQVEVDEGRAGVLRGVRQRFLHDAVDDRLLVLGE